MLCFLSPPTFQFPASASHCWVCSEVSRPGSMAEAVPWDQPPWAQSRAEKGGECVQGGRVRHWRTSAASLGSLFSPPSSTFHSTCRAAISNSASFTQSSLFQRGFPATRNMEDWPAGGSCVFKSQPSGCVNWTSGICVALVWNWVWSMLAAGGWEVTGWTRQWKPDVTSWYQGPLRNSGLWGPHLGHLNVKGRSKHVKPWTLWEQTLEPDCLDSNLDTITHWLGDLGQVIPLLCPRFSHLKYVDNNSTYLSEFLWELIELIHKVDFRIPYTVITI